jgi:hypothetical protein
MTALSRRMLRVEPLEDRVLLSASVSDLSMLAGVMVGLEGDAGTADYGDAPDGTSGARSGDYNTLDSDNGPSHTVVVGLYMGASVDGDAGTLQNAAANADDTGQALPDDEDGLNNPTADLMLTIGTQPTINVSTTNTTGANATLSGWIDYNRDGVFENATERAQAVVANGTTSGVAILTFPTVPTGFAGETYARFRLSTDAAGEAPTGATADGEVEDYVAVINAPTNAVLGGTTKIAQGLNNCPDLSSGDQFGSAVVSLGDLDGDGILDLAVGAEDDRVDNIEHGAVHILFMNSDGSVKSSTQISSGVGGGPTLNAEDRFGSALASLGDLDGDGITELAVGAWSEDTGGTTSGAVYVLFMNTDGTVKNYTKIANNLNGGPTLAVGDSFGYSISAIGDLNSDGLTDLAVGAIRNDTGGSNRGAVHILFMNSDGTSKSSQIIANGVGGGPTLENYDYFGSAVSMVGDLDLDGVPDLVVGVDGDGSGEIGRTGAVYVLFMNPTGTVKSFKEVAHEVNGGPTLGSSDRFGSSIALLGDINADGTPDLAVGAYGDSSQGNMKGAVHFLMMNSDGTVKSTKKIVDGDDNAPVLGYSDYFGQSLSAGDFNEDGTIDLVVGTMEYVTDSSRGAVHLLFMGSTRLYVDVDSPAGSSGDGDSWETAFNSLDTANSIADARNSDADPYNDIQEIWIADGVYTPDTAVSTLTGDRNYSFQPTSNVLLVGGFQGTETSKDNRSRLADGSLEFETILSGDRLQNDSEGDVASKIDNSQSVIFLYGAGNFRLEGMTIEGGYADGAYTSDSSLESASSGAGMFAFGTNVSLREVNFRDNYALGHGGALRSRSSTVEIHDSRFKENRADKKGGGINSASDGIAIEDCLFEGNTGIEGGGGATSWRGDAVVRNSLFRGNRSDEEGGGYSAEGLVSFENNIVVGNTAPLGAGLYAGTKYVTLSMVNSTISGNNGTGFLSDVSTNLSNTLIAGNTIDLSGTVTGTHNLIGNGDDQTGLTNGVDGNIFGTVANPSNPRFARSPSDSGDGWGDDPATPGVDEGANDDYGDLQLTIRSSAIDAGDNAIVPAALTTDFFGDVRFKDSDADASTSVDIGADEFTGFDFGDAPDAGAGTDSFDYETLAANGGPSHEIVVGLYMGDMVDIDDGHNQNVAANADDVDRATPDDEDGLVNPVRDLTLTIGERPTVNILVTNTTGVEATLSGWIDYNGNGVYDNDREYAQTTVSDGTTSQVVTLTFSGIRGAFTGATYARFRLSTDPAAEEPIGFAMDGEVEDYAVTINVPSTGIVESTTKIASGTPGMSTLNAYDFFGNAVTQIGDLDGDGVVDLAVGATGDDTGGDRRGALHVLFMNADGTVKSTQEIASETGGGPTLSDIDFLETSLRAIGDLNGDGVIDLAAGAYGDDTGGGGRGAVYVLMMNTDGTAQSTTKIASDLNGGPTLSDYDYFGWSLDEIGDLDGDGVTDIAVAAHNASIGGTGRGAVHVLFMNSDGTIKNSQIIAHDTGGGPLLSDNDNFGRSLASLGDLDGDGITDLAVGADRDDASGSNHGAVHVLFMNSDGTVKSTQKIAGLINGGPFLQNDDKFGTAVAPLGDINGDGVTDLAVGAREDDTGGSEAGAVYLLTMNSDGTVASSQKIAHNLNGGPTLSLGDRFGGDVVSLGDLNGDGVSELAVGAWGDDTGGTDAGAVHILFMEPEPMTSVLYVDADSTYDISEGDSGTSWATALPDLEDAYDLIPIINEGRDPADFIQTIWIAEGVYLPRVHSDADNDGLIDDDDVRSKTFTLLDGVSIYGGFAGDEADLASRHGGATILSGDLNRDDATGGDNSENAYTVVTVSFPEKTTILDSVTITGGNANCDDPYWVCAGVYGGGIFVEDTSPEDGILVLKNVNVTENYSESSGGGICVAKSQLYAINTTIDSNSSGGKGGGIHNWAGDTILVNCVIANNSAVFSGGGISNPFDTIRIYNSTIVNNTTGRYGGGAYLSDVALVYNSIFADNTAAELHPTLYIFGYEVVVRNTFIDEGENIHGVTHGVDGNIVGTPSTPIDPYFTDPSTGDYGLQLESLAINSGSISAGLPFDEYDIDRDGDTTERLPLDRNGDVRLIAERVDMGAYEATDIGYDFGDAPDPTYPTLLANDGARHYPVGPLLGYLRDGERDGQPSANADGDDLIVKADEDGLMSLSDVAPGRKDVILSVHASLGSYLNAWIDFNANGIWDSSEQIAVDEELWGSQILFDVPLDALPGTTFLRMRLTSYDTGGTLLPTGPADDGEVEDHAVTIFPHIYLEGTESDDIVHVYPGTPGGTDHRVSINGASTYYDASIYESIYITGASGQDSLSIHGKPTYEYVNYSRYDVRAVEPSVYAVEGFDFENIYAFSGGGEDTTNMKGSGGDDDAYINEGYSYLRGDSRAFLNYAKGYDIVNFTASYGAPIGTDRVYIYDSTGDDTLVAGESRCTLDYNSDVSTGFNATTLGFYESNAYAVNGGHDIATLTGSDGNDRFTARDIYGRMRGNDGAYIHYAEGFDVVTGDASGTSGTDIATLFDGSGNDRLVASESNMSLDLDATPGIDDFNLVAIGFDHRYAYAIRGGNDTALMTGSDGADRFTSKRAYSSLKRRDGAFFNYVAGWDEVTADVSGGAGPDQAFLYDEPSDDIFEATPTQATIDYDATIGSPEVDGAAIGFDEVYAYAESGGNDTATMTGSTGLDRFTSLPTYSYLTAEDGSYFNYARGFDAVTAISVGTGDLAFLYGSDGNDVLNAGSASAAFTLNPIAGGQVVNTAAAFDQVYGYASGGGTDTANLTGTTGADAFKGDADWGYLRSKGTSDYFNYVRYFDEVFADPSDTDVGNDDLDDLGVSYALDATPGNGNAW